MNVRRNGFTIVEIMVVVVILGLLAAFVMPGLFKNVGKAKTKLAKTRMALVIGALEQFAIDCTRYPTTDEGLDALVEAPAELEDDWGPRYLSASQILDPWDRPYIYFDAESSSSGSYELICLGADGEEGGEGENADIYND